MICHDVELTLIRYHVYTEIIYHLNMILMQQLLYWSYLPSPPALQGIDLNFLRFLTMKASINLGAMIGFEVYAFLLLLYLVIMKRMRLNAILYSKACGMHVESNHAQILCACLLSKLNQCQLKLLRPDLCSRSLICQA